MAYDQQTADAERHLAETEEALWVAIYALREVQRAATGLYVRGLAVDALKQIREMRGED